MRMRRLAVSSVVTVLLLTTGCSSGAPAETESMLVTRLSAVDAAIAAGDDEQAGAAVRDLIDAAVRAERAGGLDPEHADEIVAAADALLAQLPGEGPAERTTPLPTDQPVPSTTTPSLPATPETTAPAPSTSGQNKDGAEKGKPTGKSKNGKGKR